MLTTLSSVLNEMGYFGDWRDIQFKLYKLEGVSFPLWASVSDYQTPDDDLAYKLLSHVFDTDKPHPLCYQLTAYCNGRTMTLTTKYNNEPLKVVVEYGKVNVRLEEDKIQRFASMPAGSHL